MLKSPCTGYKAELYKEAGLFGPSATRLSLDIIYVPKQLEGLHILRTQSRGHGTGVDVVSICLHSRKISLQIYTGINVSFIGDPSPPDNWKRRILLSQLEETFHITGN